jgi:hypothetical protein
MKLSACKKSKSVPGLSFCQKKKKEVKCSISLFSVSAEGKNTLKFVLCDCYLRMVIIQEQSYMLHEFSALNKQCVSANKQKINK